MRERAVAQLRRAEGEQAVGVDLDLSVPAFQILRHEREMEEGAGPITRYAAVTAGPGQLPPPASKIAGPMP